MNANWEQDDQGPTSADLVRDELDTFGVEWDAMVEAARPTPMQMCGECDYQAATWRGVIDCGHPIFTCDSCHNLMFAAYLRIGDRPPFVYPKIECTRCRASNGGWMWYRLDKPTPMQAAIECAVTGVPFQDVLKARRETDPCHRCGGSGLELVATQYGRSEPWDEEMCSHCGGDGVE